MVGFFVVLYPRFKRLDCLDFDSNVIRMAVIQF